jgi:hypothetical protein
LCGQVGAGPVSDLRRPSRWLHYGVLKSPKGGYSGHVRAEGAEAPVVLCYVTYYTTVAGGPN